MVIIFLVSLFLVVFIYHLTRSYLFEKTTNKIGQKVTIKGKKMNFSLSSKNAETIIFLSGGLTASPILDFKLIANELSEYYQLLILEKFGYGWSDDSNDSRNVEQIVEEYRELLSKEKISAPYFLAPHSMSGIEALYWYEHYPEEVKGIVGIDMATPEAYEQLPISTLSLATNRLLIQSGIVRCFPKLVWSDAIKEGYLTKQEIKTYEELFYKNFTSKAVWNEVKTIKDSAKKVNITGLSNLPMLIFNSNGVGTGVNLSDWSSFQKTLKEKSNLSKMISYDCPHYIHHYQFKEMGLEIQNFIDELNQ